MENKKEFIGDLSKLIVYQKALVFHKKIYGMIDKLPTTEKYNLCDQIRRAITSVVANVAEGYARISYKEEYNFLNIAVGSLSETRSFLDICLSVNYISSEEYESLDNEAEQVLRMLIGKMKSVKKMIE